MRQFSLGPKRSSEPIKIGCSLFSHPVDSQRFLALTWRSSRKACIFFLPRFRSISPVRLNLSTASPLVLKLGCHGREMVKGQARPSSSPAWRPVGWDAREDDTSFFWKRISTLVEESTVYVHGCPQGIVSPHVDQPCPRRSSCPSDSSAPSRVPLLWSGISKDKALLVGTFSYSTPRRRLCLCRLGRRSLHRPVGCLTSLISVLGERHVSRRPSTPGGAWSLSPTRCRVA